MRVYHRTRAAQSILSGGFRDGQGTYLTFPPTEYTGVWLSDIPLDVNEGVKGDTLLVMEMPEEVVSQYEWVEEGKGYREFLVPAAVVNLYGPPKVVAPDEEGRIADRRFAVKKGQRGRRSRGRSIMRREATASASGT